MTISKRTLIWLVPACITIHNLEEALFMPAFLQARNSSMPGFLQRLLPPITYRQLLISLIIVTTIPYLIAWLAILKREGERGIQVLLGLQIVMLFNVFAHAWMAVVMRGYAPGVVTAFAINLPFSYYFMRRALREGWVSRRALALLIPIGLLIHVVGLPGIIILSGSI